MDAEEGERGRGPRVADSRAEESGCVCTVRASGPCVRRVRKIERERVGWIDGGRGLRKERICAGDVCSVAQQWTATVSPNRPGLRGEVSLAWRVLRALPVVASDDTRTRATDEGRSATSKRETIEPTASPNSLAAAEDWPGGSARPDF